MSGSWIKVEHTTPDKPEVIRMASRLAVSVDEVFGKLVRLWMWADQHSMDGKDLPITEAIIDERMKHVGFAQAMREAGWLTGADWSLTFPDFDRHNGITAKKRALDSRRKGLRNKGNTGPKKVRKVSAKSRNESVKMPEQRREEKNREEDLIPSTELNPKKEIAADAANGVLKNPDPPEQAPVDLVPETKPATPRKLKKARERPPEWFAVFDALVEITKLDPDVSGGRLATETWNLFKAKPPYTAEEVRQFGAEHCSWWHDKGKYPDIGWAVTNMIKVRTAKPETEHARRIREAMDKQEDSHGQAPVSNLARSVLPGFGAIPD